MCCLLEDSYSNGDAHYIKQYMFFSIHLFAGLFPHLKWTSVSCPLLYHWNICSWAEKILFGNVQETMGRHSIIWFKYSSWSKFELLCFDSDSCDVKLAVWSHWRLVCWFTKYLKTYFKIKEANFLIHGCTWWNHGLWMFLWLLHSFDLNQSWYLCSSPSLRMWIVDNSALGPSFSYSSVY